VVEDKAKMTTVLDETAINLNSCKEKVRALLLRTTRIKMKKLTTSSDELKSKVCK